LELGVNCLKTSRQNGWVRKRSHLGVLHVNMMSMQMVELTARRLVMILVMVAEKLEFWVTRNPSKRIL
jgi:hypothetical protein